MCCCKELALFSSTTLQALFKGGGRGEHHQNPLETPCTLRREFVREICIRSVILIHTICKLKLEKQGKMRRVFLESPKKRLASGAPGCLVEIADSL